MLWSKVKMIGPHTTSVWGTVEGTFVPIADGGLGQRGMVARRVAAAGAELGEVAAEAGRIRHGKERLTLHHWTSPFEVAAVIADKRHPNQSFILSRDNKCGLKYGLIHGKFWSPRSSDLRAPDTSVSDCAYARTTSQIVGKSSAVDSSTFSEAFGL